MELTNLVENVTPDTILIVWGFLACLLEIGFATDAEPVFLQSRQKSLLLYWQSFQIKVESFQIKAESVGEAFRPAPRSVPRALLRHLTAASVAHWVINPSLCVAASPLAI